MKIIMLQDQRAAPDGVRIDLYPEGSVYSVPEDISEELARIFLREKWAREVKKKLQAAKRRVRKSLDSAPENKSI